MSSLSLPSLFLPSPLPVQNMAERVCSRALGKTISKTVAKPREYTRANRSSSFRAERERDRYGSETNTRGGASGEGRVARPLRAVGKIGARTSARHISWFPVHLPSQSANAGRRGGQWEGNAERSRWDASVADRYRPCTLLPKWHGRRGTVFIEF